MQEREEVRGGFVTGTRREGTKIRRVSRLSWRNNNDDSRLVDTITSVLQTFERGSFPTKPNARAETEKSKSSVVTSSVIRKLIVPGDPHPNPSLVSLRIVDT